MQNKIITHFNFAKGYRGGERQTQLLIEEISRRGHKQKIFTRKKSELAIRLNDVRNLEIIPISKPYIFNLIGIQKSDIIHAHETKAAQVAYLANLRYNIPYIITRRVDNPIKQNFFNKNIYTKAKYTVVLSYAIKKETLKVSKQINIKIIPSSYTKLKKNKEKYIKIKEIYKNKFLIGNIGELDNTHKGQYYLIEAMKKVQVTYPNIHLIFLGKGKDKENYQQQSTELTNITFEGFVNNVGDYIHALDLFVFPSLNEGLGSILLDVIQAKVPIAASNVGGIPDIIKHNYNGLLFPSKNSEAIFQAIEKLYLAKELREKLSNNAYKDINNFSYEKMADKYLELYQSINDD